MVRPAVTKSVVIIHPYVPDYRVAFFENLYRLGQDDGITYHVMSERLNSSGQYSQNKLSKPFLWSIKVKEFSLGSRSIVKHFLSFDLDATDLVITEYAIRNLNTYNWLFFQRPKRLALWGHGRTYTKRNTQLEERLKSKLVNRSDWFFGYTTNGVSSVVQNGFPAEKTTVVQNSTNTRELKRLADLTLESEIESLKRKFMVGNGPIGVFIGELDPSKRIDFLIRCSIKIQQHCPSFQLLIFGSGIELDRVLEACRDYPFIKYCGRAEQRTQVIIAKIATFILMPGRVGLIAVDSLELGLPILTTNWSWHAPEAEYLTPGVNSEFFNDDLNDYCSGVLQLISDDNRLNLLRKGCTDSAAAYSTEIMAQNFHDGVKKILDEPEHRLYRVRKTIRDLL